MALSLRLDVRQSQSLVLTPQLQQAIRLLQLSNHDLLGTLQREVNDNPFLAFSEPPARASEGSVERTAGLDGAPALRGSVGAPEPGMWDAPAPAAAADHRLGLRRAGGAGSTGSTGADGWRADTLTRRPGLRDHLRRQIGGRRMPASVRETALRLIDWVEDDGYLREADGELAGHLEVARPLVEAARAQLQQCEPTGIGTRDLAQCLALQLAELDRLDPAMRRLLERLPALARADWTMLERWCGVDRADLEEMVAEIRALDPRPGLAFADDDVEVVLPDVLVRRGPAGGWRIELNTAVLPRVLVDGAYHAKLGAAGLKGEAREFVAERYQSATWLEKALQQRARTILRVAKAILERQRHFLELGAEGLRPLVLRDIATATGLHESTVSRATTEKYVETPHGTFSLKYFFTAAIQSASGGDGHSAEAIRQQIRQLILKEPANAVLSDDGIVEVLRSEGVSIARRTVAKYRESLGIPSSVHRRRQRALAG